MLVEPGVIWPITIGSSVLLILGWFHSAAGNETLKVLTGALVGVLAAYHTHALTQTRAFFDAFFKFNERYDQINNLLDRLPDKKKGKPNDADQSAIQDYLNRCSEEFLFCRRSYVPKEVLKAWNRGMEARFRNPWVQEHWQNERETGSYYGFEHM